jgi:hypothetical protein
MQKDKQNITDKDRMEHKWGSCTVPSCKATQSLEWCLQYIQLERSFHQEGTFTLPMECKKGSNTEFPIPSLACREL